MLYTLIIYGIYISQCCLLIACFALQLYNLNTLGVNTNIYILTYLWVNRQYYLHDLGLYPQSMFMTAQLAPNTLYWVSILPHTCNMKLSASLSLKLYLYFNT